jgi:PAS domain-containing protein
VTAVTDPTPAPKSLPLILARELAANLSTAMFLLDAEGTLVYFNDAAETIIGKPFAELGEIAANEFGEVLHMATPEGETIRRRDSPAGIAFLQHRPSHQILHVTGYDEKRRLVEATAYPLFGAAKEMHGVVSVFWQLPDEAAE